MKQINLFSLKFCVSNLNEFSNLLIKKIAKSKKTFSLLPTSMSDIALKTKHKKIRDSLKKVDYLLMDGMPIVMLARLKGFKHAERVYGPDLMKMIFEKTNLGKVKHFFYGGSKQTLLRIKKRLKKDFPQMKVAGMKSPPFRKLTPNEELAMIQEINKSQADILWVGLGSWRQIFFINKFKGKLKVKLIAAVGAAFDFYAGQKKQAPIWMRKLCLEWLFRLMTEPHRLWRRYILQFPLFVISLIFELCDLYPFVSRKLQKYYEKTQSKKNIKEN